MAHKDISKHAVKADVSLLGQALNKGTMDGSFVESFNNYVLKIFVYSKINNKIDSKILSINQFINLFSIHIYYSSISIRRHQVSADDAFFCFGVEKQRRQFEKCCSG